MLFILLPLLPRKIERVHKNIDIKYCMNLTDTVYKKSVFRQHHKLMSDRHIKSNLLVLCAYTLNVTFCLLDALLAVCYFQHVISSAFNSIYTRKGVDKQLTILSIAKLTENIFTTMLTFCMRYVFQQEKV